MSENQRFSRRVLSSTRISEADSQIDEDKGDEPKFATQRRRRLRLLEEDDDNQDVLGQENVDPLLSSFPILPSSIPFPEVTRDDEEDGSEDEGDISSDYSNHSHSIGSDEEEDEGFTVPKFDPKQRQDERSHQGRHLSPSSRNECSESVPVTAEGDGAKDDEVDEDVLNRLRRLAKGAAKKTVKHPRPKLNPQVLLSNKGLPALLEDFKKVRFRGRGHEFQDLDRLLFVYEAWANRLLPTSSFPPIIERLENLGSRREIQVALRRLRDGIWPPYMSAEIVEDDEDSDTPMKEPRLPLEVEDEQTAWERALNTMPSSSMAGSATNPSSPGLSHNLSFNDDDATEPVPGPSSSMSEEDRAERNRRLALERLAARQSTGSGISSSQVKTPRTPSLLKNALKAALPLTSATKSIDNSSQMAPLDAPSDSENIPKPVCSVHTGMQAQDLQDDTLEQNV